MARRRHLSRISVMQALFEREQHPSSDIHQSLVLNQNELGDVDMEFSSVLLKGVLENEQYIKEQIQLHAPEWTLDRMDPISRCVLMVGGFELLCAKDAPPAVVMNEAIEIAKEFGSEESGKFVNGVLNAIAEGVKGSGK